MGAFFLILATILISHCNANPFVNLEALSTGWHEYLAEIESGMNRGFEHESISPKHKRVEEAGCQVKSNREASSINNSGSQTNSQKEKNKVGKRNLQSVPRAVYEVYAEQTSDSARILQCQNGGRNLKVNKINYYCEDEWIQSEEEFIERSKSNTEFCYKNYTNIQTCYCPADYEKEDCHFWNKVTCSVTQLTKDLIRCPTFKSYYYMSNYDGDPPCLFVRRNTILDLMFKIECKNEKPENLVEGLRVPYKIVNLSESDMLMKLGSPPYFQYHYSLPTLMSSRKFNVYPSTRIINWNELSNFKAVMSSAPLDRVELTGYINHIKRINVTDIDGRFFISGRAYLEHSKKPKLHIILWTKLREYINSIIDLTFKDNSTGKILTDISADESFSYNYIEFEDYVEPVREKSISQYLIILIVLAIILFLVIIASAIYYYKIRERKKREDERNRANESDLFGNMVN